MKFIVLLSLAMLIAFSSEAKLRAQSKSTGLAPWYVNRKLYIQSYSGAYLMITNKYKLDLDKKKATEWVIKPISGDRYYVVSQNVDYLCLEGIFNSPESCRSKDHKSEWRLTPSGTNKIGFKGSNNEYLCEGTFDLTTSSSMKTKETWPITKV